MTIWHVGAVVAGAVVVVAVIAAVAVFLARRSAPPRFTMTPATAFSEGAEADAAAEASPRPWPRMPGAVAWPPDWLIGEHPFDLATFFAPIPTEEENAAPLYLEALAEFEPDMAGCFPLDRRPSLLEAAAARVRAFDRIADPDTGLARPGVAPADVERVLAEYDVGFEKLGRAQQRPRCVFELGPTFSAKVPHVWAARRVIRVLGLRNAHDLYRGEFRPAARSIGIALRLARDVQSRSSLICQTAAFAMQTVTQSLALDFLRAPGLRAAEADLLLGVLEEEERGALPYPLAEAYRVEYVYIRATLRDLEHRTEDFSPEGLRRAGDLWGRRFRTVGNYMAFVHQWSVSHGLASGATRKMPAKEIDAILARMGPADYERETRATAATYRDLIAFAERPYREQVVSRPRPYDGLQLFLPPPVEPFPVVVARVRAGLRLTRCLAAVRRWQLSGFQAIRQARSSAVLSGEVRGASGLAYSRLDLPGDLSTIVRAAGMAEVPADPFGDGPLRLAVVNGEAVVYSVGADGRDDGGRVDWDNGRREGDFVLRLGAAGR